MSACVIVCFVEVESPARQRVSTRRCNEFGSVESKASLGFCKERKELSLD